MYHLFIQEVLDSQKKFKAADTNNDEALTLEEYNAFYHPSSHKHMQQIVFEEAMAEYDENKDGKFSFKEFVAYEEGNSSKTCLKRPLKRRPKSR